MKCYVEIYVEIFKWNIVLKQALKINEWNMQVFFL